MPTRKSPIMLLGNHACLTTTTLTRHSTESIAGTLPANTPQLAELIAVPLNPIDAGKYGWISSTSESREQLSNKSYNRVAWQRAQVLNQAGEIEESSKRDAELARVNAHLAAIQQSRGHRIAEPIDKVLRRTKATALGVTTKLPVPLRNWTVRKRHLRIVNPALAVHTEPAFLGTVPEPVTAWVNPELRPDVPLPACGLDALTAEQVVAAQRMLDSGPFDSDAVLESRTDGINDELGRSKAALRTRLRLTAPISRDWDLGAGWHKDFI